MSVLNNNNNNDALLKNQHGRKFPIDISVSWLSMRLGGEMGGHMLMNWPPSRAIDGRI